MYTDSNLTCILSTSNVLGVGMKLVDRIGQRFGKLTVIEQAGRNSLKKVLWKCRCECGSYVNVVAGSLVTGNTTKIGRAHV